MNYIILYNPLSKGGLSKKLHNKLIKKLNKHNHTYSVESLLDIDDVKSYLSEIDESAKVIIIGGDGTIHYLANALIGHVVKNDVYLLKAGTGNDFLRSLKTKEKLIKINDYIKDIPYDLSTEDKLGKRYFVNSAGMGVDAYIVHLVNITKGKKGKWNYFKNVYKGFKEYSPYELTLEVDGKVKTFKKTWLAVVCNSSYFGGGMKVSPKSKRLDNELEVVVVHRISKFRVLLIFPLIYLGWHTILKKSVKIYKGKEFKLTSNADKHVQYDGETVYPRREIEVFRR